MPEDIRICSLCGSNHSAIFDRRLFRDREVTNRICRDCGLIYQSPRMTEIESAAFYTEEYRLVQESSADPTARNMAVQNKRARSLLCFVQPVIPSISRHLDIGCSMGILLRHFQEAYHNQTVGIEPGEAHRNRANKDGLKVYASLEELERTGEALFDLVSMSHVLEHLPDPVGYLIHLRESHLAPDGWLLLEVPNLYAHDSFEVAHLFAFSPHTLREVLHRSGFTIHKFEQHGRPHSTLLPLYITMLARPESEPFQSTTVWPEKQVALKRRVGMLRRKVLEKLLPGRAWLSE